MERKMQSGDRPSGRLFEDLSKLAGGALGAASGLRQDVETLVRTQAAKLVNELDLVKREEFEAVREMASKARLEQELLVARLEKLEIQLSELQEKTESQ
jgi:BMFP domain-containing protein YqiC